MITYVPSHLYHMLFELIKVSIYSTVKPLYSEHSRDPKKCSLYGGVHPRGVRYVHAHLCLNYNVLPIKTVPSLLKSHQVAEPFSMCFSSFYIMIFLYRCTVHVFLIVYHSSSTHSSTLTSQIFLTFESLISLTISSKFKFFRFADMLTKTD